MMSVNTSFAASIDMSDQGLPGKEDQSPCRAPSFCSCPPT